MSGIRSSAFIGLLATSLFLTATERAHASDVTLQTNVSETGDWESNPLMQLHDVKSIYGSTTAPELLFSDKTPTVQLSSDTVVDENLYNLSVFDSTDVHEGINFNDQPTPRWAYGAQAKVDYDTTRTSELTNFGLTTTPVRHLGLFGQPQISYNATPVDKFTLTGSDQISQYDNSVFPDYQIYALDPSYAHNFDPLDTGTFSVLAQHYETTIGTSNKVDAITPSIGWQKTFTPRLSAAGSIGPQVSRQSSGGTTTPWSWSYNFNADVTYKGIQDVTDFIATRTQTPFGNGTEGLSDVFALTEKHAINEKFSINFGANYQTAGYGSTPAPLSFKSQIMGNTGLTYHMTEHVDVTAAYQYRYETVTGSSSAAQDNLATIGIAYHPQAWGL